MSSGKVKYLFNRFEPTPRRTYRTFHVVTYTLLAYCLGRTYRFDVTTPSLQGRSSRYISGVLYCSYG